MQKPQKQIVFRAENLDCGGENELPSICFMFDAWLREQTPIMVDSRVPVHAFDRHCLFLRDKFIAEITRDLQMTDVAARRELVPDSNDDGIPF